jgi:tetratricopeptide (TPR) repeat protein
MKRLMIFAIAFVISFAAVSCKTSEFGFKSIDVNGMVYDFSNRPVANCEISLGGKYKSSTDINGRFSLPKVRAGNYTITGYKKNFENYSDEVVIKDKGQIIYIRTPSQNQLLNLADESLLANNLAAAEEMVERARQIDQNNIEMLFYYATVKFRQHEYGRAISFLETAKDLGSKDLYIDKFLTVLREVRDVRQEK